jgi:hypothetical protein
MLSPGGRAEKYYEGAFALSRHLLSSLNTIQPKVAGLKAVISTFFE